jgi:rRNA maturation RNase YbeY
MGKILWQFQKTCTLQDRDRLKLFVQAIFRQEKKKLGDLSFVFCDDEYLLGINKSFLHHDYYTDIITFDLTEPGSKVLSGEIYISIDTVRDNALHFKCSFKEELHRVIFHGCLHLCGYGDKKKVEKAVMRSKENFYLNQYGFQVEK